MATKKAGGTAKNLTDVNPHYLGVKLFGGEKAKPGAIIVRQRGTRILPGRNVGMGTDHTLFALTDGVVTYGHRRKISYDRKVRTKKIVHVL